jgi:hypothetical protein
VNRQGQKCRLGRILGIVGIVRDLQSHVVNHAGVSARNLSERLLTTRLLKLDQKFLRAFVHCAGSDLTHGDPPDK